MWLSLSLRLTVAASNKPDAMAPFRVTGWPLDRRPPPRPEPSRRRDMDARRGRLAARPFPRAGARGGRQVLPRQSAARPSLAGPARPAYRPEAPGGTHGHPPAG